MASELHAKKNLSNLLATEISFESFGILKSIGSIYYFNTENS